MSEGRERELESTRSAGELYWVCSREMAVVSERYKMQKANLMLGYITFIVRLSLLPLRLSF